MMSNNARTRFAPSPTGYLHVGGLMTALFSYLYARQQGGAFVLRIEDTDQSRFVPGAAEQLIASLKWAGLHFDEGPGAGGEYGPYVQSERTDIYRKHARQLLKSGDAYLCFCTSEELEAMRERQQAAGEPTRYDGTWRNKSETEVEAARAAGKAYVIRLKMPPSGETTFIDLVRGEVTVQNELIDDQVLVKSDGYPTYHLANVVDDHLMGITHVIRGEEWLLSVPKHLQLYKAFGWEPPKMAHLSLLLNPDRSKLSKRQGDVAVEDYIAKGYLPAALVNFVALLGWSPGSDEEFFNLDELIERFSIEKVSRSGAIFDIQKLDWMNAHYIRQLSEDDAVAFLTPFLAKAGADISDAEQTRMIIAAVYTRLSKGSEVFDKARIFYRNELVIEEQEALEFLQVDTAAGVLQAVLDKFKAVDELSMDSFKQAMKEVQQETGVKGPALWKPVRIALTGEISGPELPAVISIFGKEKACDYLGQAIGKYTG